MNYKRCIEKKSDLYGYCKRCVGKQMKDELEDDHHHIWTHFLDHFESSYKGKLGVDQLPLGSLLTPGGWNFRKVKVKKWKCKWRKNVRGERESGRSESEENWVKQSEIVAWMWWSTAAALRGWHGPPKYWRQVKVKRSKEKWKWNKLREKNEIGGCMW